MLDLPRDRAVIGEAVCCGVGGEVLDEHRESPERELAAVELREVDAIVPSEVGLDDVGSLAEYRDERC